MTAPATELRLSMAAKPENLALGSPGALRACRWGLDARASPGRPQADRDRGVHERGRPRLSRAATTAGSTSQRSPQRARSSCACATGASASGPGPRQCDGSLHLGLPLIASVVDSFAIESPAGGGTALIARVRLTEDDDETPAEPPAAPKEAELEIDAGEAAKPVIARVLAIAATRAGFSLDRMSDGVLMGDVIAAGSADDFAEGRVGIEIEECGPNLCLRVGPFQPGGAKRMVEAMEPPGHGRVHRQARRSLRGHRRRRRRVHHRSRSRRRRTAAAAGL